MSKLSALVFRAKEALMNRDTFALLPEIMAHQHLEPEVIRAQSWQKLQNVVRFSAQQVPHYRQAWQGLDLDEILASPAAFAQLPIMDRRRLNAVGTGIIAPALPGRLVTARTSGSSGDRLHFLSDACRSGWSTAARIRAWRWWGLDYGARAVRLYGRPFYGGVSLTRRLAQARDVAVNRLCGATRISAFDMNEQAMESHTRALMAIQPEVIGGYGGSLERLAQHMARLGIHLDNSRLKAVVYMAEPASDAGRQIMQTVFGAPVASEYVSREFGLIAHECPHGNLHISDDNLYLEVVDHDGRPVVGQVGEVILTDLRLSSTPYIRYRLGDLGELMPSDYRCPCGVHQRVLRRLTGRTFENVPLRDGGSLPVFVFDRLTTVVGNVSHWQARIKRPNQLRILVETSPEKLAPVHDRMQKWINERLNHEYVCTIQAVRNISPAKSGKYAKIVFEDETAP